MSDSPKAEYHDGAPETPLEGEALEQALTKQIEYYFSRENLQQDNFLVSQMNSELFVPVSLVASFKKVAQLTIDVEEIKKAMRASNVVKMNDNETMVRPNLKTERNTIILREIPSETPVEEVRAIFENDKCGEVKDIHPDLGDTWFVKFDTEEATMKTFQYLQNVKFQDKPVRCRIKAENPLRTLHNPHAGAAATPVPVDMAPAMAPYYQPMGYMPNMYGYVGPAGYMYPPNAYDAFGPHPNGGFPAGTPPGTAPFKRDFQPGQGPRRGGSTAGGAAKGGRGTGRDQPAGAGARAGRGAAAAGGAKVAKGAPGAKKPEGKARAIQLHEPSQFPPLPTAKGGKAPKNAGYVATYIKMSREEICNVIRSLPPPQRPDLPDSAGSIALDAPHLDLETLKELPASVAAAAAPEAASSPPVASHVPAAAAPAPAPAAGGKKKKQSNSGGGGGGKGKKDAPAPAKEDAEEAEAPAPAPAPSPKKKAPATPETDAAPAPAPAAKGKGKGGDKAKAEESKDKPEKPGTPPSPARSAGKSYADMLKAKKESEAAAAATSGSRGSTPK